MTLPDSVPTDAQELTAGLVSDLQHSLKENLFGVYVYGSISYGDFEASRSDIDLMVVVQNELSDEEFAAVENAWQNRKDHPWAWRVELDIVTLPNITAGTWTNTPTTHLSGGEWNRTATADAYNSNNWINIYDTGIALLGPEPKIFVPPILPEQRRAGFIRTFEHIKAHAAEWEKIDLWNQVYIVTVLALVSYNLTTLQLTSKRKGLAWAEEHWPEQFKNLAVFAAAHINDFGHPRSNELSAGIPALIEHIKTLAAG